MIKIMTKAPGSYEGQDDAYIFLNDAPTFTRKSEAEKWLENNNSGSSEQYLLVGSPKEVEVIVEQKIKIVETVCTNEAN